MKNKIASLLFLVAFIQINELQAQPRISLAGDWCFATDSKDQGIQEQWFGKKLSETIKLPGSMAENGKGDNPSLATPWTGSILDSSWFFNPATAKYRTPENFKVPFWLTPTKYYLGAAWYQKEIMIPQSWNGKGLRIFLERPHWQTMLWLDGKLIGEQNSLSVPHQYDITSVAPGKHRITVRIDNRCNEVDPGNNSHSVTDHTQGNWNGMAGRLEVHALPSVQIADVRIFPDMNAKSIKTIVVIHRIYPTSGGIMKLSAKLQDGSSAPLKELSTAYGLSDTTEIIYPMGENVKTWDEFSPSLYKLTVTLKDDSGVSDTKQVQFGMREFKINGTRFEINGRPIFLRGNVDCCVFPLTGYPATDDASWVRIFKVYKNHGLNHVRFHSYCPPEAAFIAADKAGIYIQVEGPSWANFSTSLGDGKPIDQYIYDEAERIVKAYGNHPSFCMMAYGNEPQGDYVPYLNKFLSYWKHKDHRRVYTGASIGVRWKIAPESEYLVRSKPRGLTWGSNPETKFDYRDRLEDQTKPYVTHEMGQWCVFPNFEEIPKYTGTFRAKNFEIFKADLDANHLAARAHDFLMASGKLQALCYKQEIEATLRTPGFAGFELLGLNDFPGQGTALVGVLDAFWDEKPYISSKEFSHFCNVTVPLARMEKFVYKNDEAFSAQIEVAHFGSKPMVNANPAWKIINKTGGLVASGKLPVKTIPIGNCIDLGAVNFSLKGIAEAVQLTFQVSIDQYSNQWDFWVYPAKLPAIDTTNVHICTEIDSTTESILKKGGKVLLLAAGKIENGKDVVQYYTPVFWNTSWFKMRPPHTTGILVQPEHAVFEHFPTEYWGDFQWAELSHRQQVMNLECFPPEFNPLIFSIDTWFLNRRLSMLFEAKVGKGKLMVCSIDLIQNLEKRIVARQLKYSIACYMQSDKFVPQTEVDIRVIKELFEKKDRKVWNAFTKGVPSELKKGKI